MPPSALADRVPSRVKACQACARIKARCEPEPDGKCKRCRRLNKDCYMQAAGSHRKHGHGNTQESGGIKMTLDRIVSMLDERQGRPSSHDTSDNAGHNPHMPPGSYNYLEHFMSEYAPHFPFIVIPPGTTAEDLARDQPFFYLVLCMVACPDGKKQRDLVASVKRYVAEHVIFDGERSLDVVKGLLVYLAWHHTVILPKHMNLSVMAHLAIGQLSSLGLNQAPGSPGFPNYLRELNIEGPQTARTLDERRIYLGCYYATSIILTAVRDIEPIRSSEYTDQCCDLLSETMEYPGDARVIQLVRSCQLADRIHHTFRPSAIRSGSLPAALSVSMRWYEGEIKRLTPSDSAAFDVRVHHCYLSVLLYRIAIIDGNSTTSIESYAVTRLELFSSCLEALRAMFNQLFASPPEHMPLFPHAFWIQAAHSLMILVHLPLCPAAALGGFDTKHVESVLSYLELIGTLGARFSEAQRLREERYRREGLDVELPWMFTAMQARIRSLKDYYIQHQLAGAEEPGVAFDMTVNPLFLTGVFPDDMFSFY